MVEREQWPRWGRLQPCDSKHGLWTDTVHTPARIQILSFLRLLQSEFDCSRISRRFACTLRFERLVGSWRLERQDSNWICEPWNFQLVVYLRNVWGGCEGDKLRAQIKEVLIQSACVVPQKPEFLTDFPGLLTHVITRPHWQTSVTNTRSVEGSLCLLNTIFWSSRP